MADKKIKTYGFELVLVGIVTFLAIIAFSILTYKVFIKKRAQKSVEYQTATYFVVNSQTLKDQLLTPIASIEFDDLSVSVRSEDFSVCEINFRLMLDEGLSETLRVGLVKVADFWVVHDAVLSADTPLEYWLVSPYQKILLLLDRLSMQDFKSARVFLELIKKESRDYKLVEYLSARVNAMAGNDVYARQLLDDLKNQVVYGKPAVLYERAMIDFVNQRDKEAIAVFEEIITEINSYTDPNAYELTGENIFAGMPKDPFIASFTHDTILADVYQNMALAYYNLKNYEEGLSYADQALTQAEEIESKVIRSSSLFVRALNLYALGRFVDADAAFTEVIKDLDNTNLTQKAWAYFYRANIAAHFDKHRDALDYYETAVGLDPFNSSLRKGAVEYLLTRGLKGDFEVALGMALRGIDYEADRDLFEGFASTLYKRLGLKEPIRAEN